MSPEALERFHRQVAELEGAARVPRMRDSVQHGRGLHFKKTFKKSHKIL